MEDAVVPKDDYINYEIIIDDDDSLDSDIYPPKKVILEIGGVDNETERRGIEVVDS